MSKNKLHTLSKYEADRLNHIAFMPREDKNIFNGLLTPSNSLSTPNFNSYNFGNYKPLASSDIFKQYGIGTTGSILSGYNTNSTGVGSNVFNSTSAMQQAMNNVFPTPVLQDYTATPFQRRDIGPKVDNVTKTTFSDNFKIPNITINSSSDGKTFSIKEAFGKDALKAAGKTALNAGIGIAGNLVGQGAKAAISGGRSSDIGNGISSLGSTIGGAVGTANPLLGAAITAGSGVLGGLWNGAFGAKWNKENIADIENNIAQMRATDLSSVNSNAALLDAWGRVNLGYDFDQDYIGKNGWLNHKATRKYNKLNAMQKAARAYVQHQLGVAADQADSTQDDLAQGAFIYSDGGFLDNILNSDMGSGTKYLLASNDLDIKRQNADTRAKMASMYAGTPGTFFAEGGPLNVLCGGGKMFAIGGDMQTNGGDFSTGLSHINAGLSHELNPNEGVQVGTDSQGIPNLVEEGEVIWNDYVFSARIEMDDESKEVFHINKKRDITYADQAKRLEREIKERPNDPISKTAFNAQMEKLQEQQERQKTEMEAQRAQEAFAALSPEEQTAVMQQVAQQEQAAQNAAIQEQAAQEQAIAEQQAMQGQPTSEEATMMQQQQVMQAEPQIGQQQVMGQPMMAAYGGNLFAEGGDTSKYKGKNVSQILEMLKAEDYYTSDEDLQKQAEDIHNTLIEEIKNSRDNKRYEQSIEWLNKKHPEFGNQLKEIVAKLIVNNASSNGITGTFNPETTFRKMVPTTNFSDNNVEKYIRKLMQDGSMPFESALAVANTFNPKRGNSREYIQQSIKLKPKFEAVSSNTSATQSVDNAPQENATVPNRWNLGNTYTGFTGGTTSYNTGSSNSSSDANTRDKVKESVLSHYGTPDERTIVGNIIDSISDNDFANFKNLDDNGKMAYIINAFENQNQDSGNDVPAKAESSQSVKPAAQNQQSTTQRSTGRSSTYRNVGELKEDPQTAWRNFVLPGLNKFIDEWEDRINNAATQEERSTLVDQMVNDFNGIQQSYNDSVWPNIGKSGYYYDPKVESHQKDWSRNYGNTGFFVAQPDGTTIDAVGQAVDKAGSMGDNPNDGGIDGYNGPNTALRNFGATMYGDAAFYKPIIDRFRNLGVDYRLSDSLKNGDDALYILSRRAAQTPTSGAEVVSETPAQEGKVSVVPVDAVNGKPAVGKEVTTKPGEPVKKYAYRPNLVEETNLGMYGPLVNLGMMAAGIGKPDYTELDKAMAIANRPVKLASYQPIGDYIKYRPMDIWAAQNRMDANARATDRAIMNSASPSNQAALLANAYTSQLGSGELFRQSLEYNDNLKKQVADFNRGTNIQNANAFNQLSQFNASQLNADKQRRAYMAANIAGQKMDADASWYNSLYGNVNSMFTNIANREREIRDRNWMAKMAADGLLGNLGDSYTGQGLITKIEVAKGGKLKRKKNKKKGLTI